MPKRTKRPGAALIAAILLAGASQQALAQGTLAQATEQPENAAAPSRQGSSYENAINDIVVTAQKKGVAERAQDVPIALNAFSSSALEAAHVKDLTDISNLIPSVRLNPSGSVKGYGTFFIRGTGVAGSIPSNDPAIGTFINGMPLGIATGSLTELFDLGSVEVLRGPQGTLFGRNVTGGAILLNTARPNGDLHAFLRAGAGLDGQRAVEGSVEGGSDNRIFSAKLSFLLKHNDGFYNDLQSGTPVGRSNTNIIRPTIVFKPSTNLVLSLMGEIGHDYGDESVAFNIFDPTTNITKQGYVPPAGKFDVRLNTHGNSDLKWKHAVANIDWGIGAGTISSVTGLRSVSHDHYQDSDGSPVVALEALNSVRQHQFFQELRYAGKPFGTDAISITAGGNYFDQFYSSAEYRNTLGSQTGQKGTISHKVTGFFAQSDFEILRDVTLTAGARYTIERKASDVASRGRCTIDLLVCTYDFSGAKSWHNFGPKAGINWKPSRDFLIYATWSKGFRSGGFNLRNTLPSVPGPYNEETVDAYEIGFKSDLLDRHVRFNTAAYINKNRGLQEVVAINQVQTVENAANATTRGFEADLTLIPISGLVFTGSLGYVDAKYDSFNSLDLNGDRIPDPALAVLLKLPQVPKWTYSAAANYQFSMGKIGLMSLRASWSHVDSRFADVINKVPLKAYDVIDASASLDINDHVSVGVYGKNLTNELYSQFGVYTSLFSYYFPSPPRSWFAEIRIKY